MLTKCVISAAASTTTIHAPSANLANAVTTITSPVVAAPRLLMSAFHRQSAGRRVSHRRTMPTCESVNDVNTPSAYSGISRWVVPSKSAISAEAETPRMMAPLENTRRSPRLANWRGR
jgi:hypothetical protein